MLNAPGRGAFLNGQLMWPDTQLPAGNVAGNAFVAPLMPPTSAIALSVLVDWKKMPAWFGCTVVTLIAGFPVRAVHLLCDRIGSGDSVQASHICRTVDRPRHTGAWIARSSSLRREGTTRLEVLRTCDRRQVCRAFCSPESVSYHDPMFTTTATDRRNSVIMRATMTITWPLSSCARRPSWIVATRRMAASETHAQRHLTSLAAINKDRWLSRDSR